MARTIKCTIDKVPLFDANGNKKSEVDYTGRVDGLATAIQISGVNDNIYEVQLPSGEVMRSDADRDTMFQKAFGCSEVEWTQRQRDTATKISLEELFAGKDLQTPTMYHIKEELEARQKQGENVYVEINGAKFHSIDSMDLADFDSFVSKATDMLEPTYRKSLQAEAQYVSSEGMSTDEIAKAMAEAHRKGLNIYTSLPDDVLPRGVNIRDRKVYAISIPSEEMFYTRTFGITKNEYEKFKTYDRGLDFLAPSNDWPMSKPISEWN